PPSSRGDGRKAGNSARERARHAWRGVARPGDEEPGDHPHRGGYIRVDEGGGGDAVGGQGAATIEAEPPKPEQPRAQGHVANIVRQYLLTRSQFALAYNKHRG